MNADHSIHVQVCLIHVFTKQTLKFGLILTTQTLFCSCKNFNYVLVIFGTFLLISASQFLIIKQKIHVSSF